MIESEIEQTTHPDKEPQVEFVTGDVVSLKHTNDHNRVWVLTSPAKEIPNIGLQVGAIELGQNGEMIAPDGSIEVSNIKERIGNRKSVDEIVDLYLQYFENSSLSRAEITAMVLRNLDVEQTGQ